MDTLAVCLTGACNEVEHIYAERVVNAATRRDPLQKKVGAGLAVEQFRNLADLGKLGHRDMKESVTFIARGLGWQLDTIKETLDPMVSEKDITTNIVEIKSEHTAGIKNIGAGYNRGKELIKLDLRMYVGADNPRDFIKITGIPPIELVVTNRFAGDTATVASLENSIPRVMKSSTGTVYNDESAPAKDISRRSKLLIVVIRKRRVTSLEKISYLVVLCCVGDSCGCG